MHRVKLAGLPSFAPLTFREPPSAAAVHVVGVGDLEAWVQPGLGICGQGKTLLPEHAGVRMTSLHGAVDLLAATCVPTDRLPTVVTQVELWTPRQQRRVDGQAVGLAQGAAVVLDLKGKRMRAFSAELEDTVEVPMHAGMDLLNPPLVTVSADGATALFMDARQERGEASLEHVNLRSGEKHTLLGPLSAPSWMAASQSATGRVAAAVMELGDDASFTLMELRTLQPPRTVLKLAGPQPHQAPVFVSDAAVALQLCLNPNSVTGTGPAQLVLVSLDGGAPFPVSSALDGQFRLRATPQALLLEGGRRLGVLQRIP